MLRITSLIFALLVSWSACAQVPLTGAGKGAPGGGAITFSLTWLTDAVENAGGTTVNYASLSFGAADPNRIIAVGIAARMSTVNTISSVTIGGIAATLVPSTVTQMGGTNGSNIAIYQAAVPTGATGTVSVTYGAATIRTGVTLYRIITGTPASTSGNATNNAANPISTTITVPVGGAGFAVYWESAAATAITWSNSTQDMQVTSGGASVFSSATMSSSGSTTPTATGSAAVQGIAAAAWGS